MGQDALLLFLQRSLRSISVSYAARDRARESTLAGCKDTSVGNHSNKGT